MELIVQNDFRTMTTRFYLKEIDNGKTRIIGQDNGILIATIIDDITIEKEPIKPLLEMNMTFADRFLKAVAEYNSEAGVKTEKDSLIQGKLNATERHLEHVVNNFDKLIDHLVLKRG